MLTDDGRRLPEIAAEMDSLAWVRRESEEEGDRLYEGHSELMSIQRQETGLLVVMRRDNGR